ncbi:MAG TPA: hypothetical protein VIG06_25595 [Kofleriaceae bacterium]
MSAATKAFAILAAAAGLLGGCLLDIDFDGTKFSCDDGKCPDGFSCVESTCVAQSSGDDGGPGGDGGQADAGRDGGLLTCDEQFGAALQYTLCAEEATTCEFFVQSEVAATCMDICPIYDAECVNSFDSDGAGMECTRLTEDACLVTHQSQICICSRG